MYFNLDKDKDCNITKNFKLSEFRCNDGSKEIYIDIGLVHLLQMLRDKVNAPIKIVSAYRTKEYNSIVGGALNSYHCLGLAVDISCNSKTPSELKTIAKSLGFNGIGLYDNFLHIDLRLNPYEWDNRNNK